MDNDVEEKEQAQKEGKHQIPQKEKELGIISILMYHLINEMKCEDVKKKENKIKWVIIHT